ncbi:TPA: cytochrome-c peroxidase [Methanosarcina acetivorans]|uniref:Cytochrome c peroxidase n=2 Tax=Methanosarcina acetivorans TaxID=2214 RepID=Q8TLW5_METAC|nr:cytochrome-c peroxidase [Methanosarcina acetivorans]AAM06284.1 cytochrome c peroxidase [Methanosarcina acetivorans C2A]HIH95203.1 cytochrome-c peroxidase [Methanosarcina acetivorans]
MRIGTTTLISILFLTALAVTASAEEVQLSQKEELGKLLFFDESLSMPRGQSCASCHDPDFGFTDPDQDIPVSQGVIPILFGNRNAPSAAYATYSPNFSYTYDDSGQIIYYGGQFWDGRADNLTEQAKGPLLNPLEMHNPNKRTVVMSIRRSDYADLFEEVYGPCSLNNVDVAFDYAADAIAVYESSEEVNTFSSRYDEYLEGEYTLSDEEKLGLELFNGKALCSGCHISSGSEPIFTDFTYDNLGVPKNPDNPFYSIPRVYNPLRSAYVDLGLGGSGRTEITDPEGEEGKMKVPTLRNIGKTAPYTHNGYFTNLEDIVHFYNTRDVASEGWPEPEVAANVNTEEMGDLGLNDSEERAIVAFLLTLDDE